MRHKSISICMAAAAILQLQGTGHAADPRPGEQAGQYLETEVMQEVALDYLLYLPSDYKLKGEKAWPLVLFLHGAGERGDDLSLVKKHGPPMQVESGRDFPFILVSPQCPEGKIWKPHVLIGLLDAIQARYRVDSKRVYVTGLSMGGYATWELAAAHPDRFAAIAPICGGGSMIWTWALRDTPVWAFHGAEDPVVPPEESKRLIERLKAQNDSDEVRLTIYEGVEHNSWEKAYANDELYDWLLSQ